MASIPQTSGVYQIRSLESGKVYIGSAINLRRRWWKHRKDLRGGAHTNKHLQAAWNKYGEAGFAFEVLELVLEPFLTAREQVWMNKMHSHSRQYGYNAKPNAHSMAGYRHSEDTKARIGSKFATTWEGFISPDGNEVVIHNLRAFCREHGLNPKTMSDLAHGKAKQVRHRGWGHKNQQPRPNHLPVYEGFVDPDGNSVEPIINMAAFCRERGLNASCMMRTYRGHLPQHKGWTCPGRAINLTTVRELVRRRIPEVMVR